MYGKFGMDPSADQKNTRTQMGTNKCPASTTLLISRPIAHYCNGHFQAHYTLLQRHTVIATSYSDQVAEIANSYKHSRVRYQTK